ncbi:MAG TPA: SDR family NAD(P)-dependent oxidoreductase [Hypericibacter adhaerens]|jgi:NAD(P)-dependent dehydrogenase (short-subunit alcohol dehydrogenase family)|uniref:Short-chain dehydrogenase n=1 Tax=Hypericibacter adhaerens TaxID=2602016 RepID=A0A5J6MX43_9PROT|nr:SDR family NAD(P)-dependent oxidoreductase [Hypericibacter adhaerens]QEX22238.1 short-chain dehydrogenase [Hypericibacter adhaerens]HWA44092.1 SDR family NAD(P)-dependent oxidoreductase [Hypericibacter adhaerens]
MSWSNKTVLVTGGSGGMGRAIVARFLAEGANIAAADIDAKRLGELERDMKAGPRFLAIPADVTRVADCERMVGAALERFGGLDVLVNGAGVWVEGASDEATEAEWDRTLDINLKGTFFACRYAIPALEKTGGTILNIASDAGLIGNSGSAIYCASKGGVVLLTKALARELAPRGIRVNAICPCDVETPMLQYQANTYGGGNPRAYLDRLLSIYPQGARARFVRAEEVAEFVFQIASPKLTPITGAALSMDFGTTAGL